MGAQLSSQAGREPGVSALGSLRAPKAHTPGAGTAPSLGGREVVRTVGAKLLLLLLLLLLWQLCLDSRSRWCHGGGSKECGRQEWGPGSSTPGCEDVQNHPNSVPSGCFPAGCGRSGRSCSNQVSGGSLDEGRGNGPGEMRGVNSGPRLLLRKGVLMGAPLWAVMDVYGTTKAIKLLDPTASAFPSTAPRAFIDESLQPEATAGEECAICFHHAANTCLVPCGHTHFCSYCALRVFRDLAKCPVCRWEIKAVVPSWGPPILRTGEGLLMQGEEGSDKRGHP
ncbi:e3 ubiquitin-protein ligase [Lynx pardinus]|uniref:E3 ubiquitin-protein ligase n=1 Tax=Lynx pardinus TaxID=191816 RepID=A0A485MQZ1_LYNPA|nr:e3 ubiquitin-protein ligase [Lynx pardinus]